MLMVTSVKEPDYDKYYLKIFKRNNFKNASFPNVSIFINKNSKVI